VLPIDVQTACIDLLAFPGHKSLFGPTGTGALYVGTRANLRPWREGGTGGDSLTPTQPTDFPHHLEGGTPNVLGVAGLVAGLDFVEERGVEAIRKHEVELCDRLRHALTELPGFELFGHADANRRVGALSFRCEVLPAPELAGLLDQSFDIAVRPGLHCAPYIHKALGTAPDGLVRVSPGPFTTNADIDQLIDALKEITGGM
jgi:selenocysteine lyase/cysteine desulfurase